MHHIKQYEERKEKLKEYLNSLDQKCKLFVGPHTKYVYPVDNPYTQYYDVNQFKKKNVPHENEKAYLIKQKVCKFLPQVNATLDNKGRFYTMVSNATECKAVQGHWDLKTVDRKNKFDRGVCWKDPIARVCGQQIQDQSVLRPYRAKFDPDFNGTIAEEANRCNKHPECTWEQQTAFTFDCVPRKSLEADAVISTPPEAMPLAEFESFLEKWYVQGIPSKAPKTMSPLGQGDRCKGLDNLKNILPPPPSLKTKREYVEFESMDPKNEKDKLALKEKLGPDFEDFMIKWKAGDSRGLVKYYHKLETAQLEYDYPVGASKKEPVFLPSIPQSIVNMVAKNMATKHGKNRGLLAWHSTGSGKTATATGVIDSFWDDTERRIVFASSLDAIASNPDWKFHQCAQRFFPRFHGLSLDIIGEMFKKRGVKFYSFARLSNRVNKAEQLKKEKKHVPNNDEHIDLDKCILIIDEVHNLFRPLPTQQQQHEYLESQLVDPKKHPGLKVVILTATPGDNIPDVVKLLNIVRTHDAPIIKIPDMKNAKDIDSFKTQIRGLVSFFDMSGDDTRFPLVKDTEPIKYPMSDTQFAKYVDAFKTVSALQKNFGKLAKKNHVYKYWAPARKYANMLFKFDKDMKLSDFSSKIPAFLEALKTYDKEKHYLYSAFYTSHGYGGQGVVAIGKQLEKAGYKKLTFAEAKKFNKANKLPPIGKRYILATNNELGDDAGNNLAEMIKIYNHPDNKDGQYVHVMVASQGYNEGIDLKAVRHIHIFEPLVTMASDKQAIGRAARSCSHEDLFKNKGEWTVRIHRYMSGYPASFVAQLKKDPVVGSDATSLLEKNEEDKKAIDIAKTSLKEAKAKQKTKQQQKKIDKLQSEIDALSKKLLSPAKVKDLKAQIKQAALLDIPLIEEKVYEESRERMKDLLTIYKCMQEAAIDCRILQRFHATTGHDIACAF